MDPDVALLLILTLIGHSTVAYTTVWYIFKKKGEELKKFGEPENLARVIGEVMGQKGMKDIVAKIGDVVFDKFLTWALSDQAAAVADKLVEKTVLRVKQYLGGVQTGLLRSAQKGVADAEVDIGGIIKKIIINKIMQSDLVKKVMGEASDMK